MGVQQVDERGLALAQGPRRRIDRPQFIPHRRRERAQHHAPPGIGPRGQWIEHPDPDPIVPRSMTPSATDKMSKTPASFSMARLLCSSP